MEVIGLAASELCLHKSEYNRINKCVFENISDSYVHLENGMPNFLKALVKFVGIVAVLFLSHAAFPTYAADGNPIIYDYDELGRLVGLTDAAGNSAAYRYDAAGNILSIIRSSPSQPVIMGNAPGAGPEGTPVTISGSGFSITANQNKVRFNQTIATVMASTSTQITTNVPVGATTGPISVVTPTGTATSATAFVVQASQAPTITGFTPNIGPAGSLITISGTNFDGDVSKVAFNRHFAVVRSIASKSIVAMVPANVTSGPISVGTGYGVAISDGDFFIPPAQLSVSDIQVTGRMAIGTSKTVTMSAIGKKGLILFDGTAGQTISLSLSSVTLASGTVSILSPDGTVLATTTTSTTGRFIDAKVLPAAGTYTILINPSANSTGDLTLTLNSAPDVVSRISFDGVAVTVATTKPGQNASLTFNATAGQRFSVNLSSVLLSDGNYMGVSILKPDGSTLISSSYVSSSGRFIDVQTAPVTGIYTIKLNPQAMAVGQISVQLFDVGRDPEATVLIGGPAVTVATTVPGQNASLTFAATVGQRFSMSFSGVALSAGGYLGMNILKPDGSTLTSSSYVASSGAFIDVQTAPVTGTYTIKLDPNAMTVGKATIQLFDDTSDPTAAIAIGGPAVTLGTTVPGQNASLTFTATTGQRFSMNLSNVVLASGGYLSVSVLKPDGTTLVSSGYISTSGAFIDVQTAPVTGTYAIKLDPNALAVGKATVQLFDDASDPSAAIVIGGPAVTVATAVPGQNASLTFTATAGQRFSLNFSGVVLTSGGYMSVNVLKPDGTALGSPGYISAPGGFIDVQTAPMTGTYTIKFDPSAMTVGKATVQLIDVAPDPTATIAIGGSAVTVVTTAPGQNASLAFNGAAGQSITVRITATTLDCQSIGLRKPDGSSLYSHLYCGTTFTLPQQTLPVVGTYIINVDPYGASTGKTSVTLTSP